MLEPATSASAFQVIMGCIAKKSIMNVSPRPARTGPPAKTLPMAMSAHVFLSMKEDTVNSTKTPVLTSAVKMAALVTARDRMPHAFVQLDIQEKTVTLTSMNVTAVHAIILGHA